MVRGVEEDESLIGMREGVGDSLCCELNSESEAGFGRLSVGGLKYYLIDGGSLLTESGKKKMVCQKTAGGSSATRMMTDESGWEEGWA